MGSAVEFLYDSLVRTITKATGYDFFIEKLGRILHDVNISLLSNVIFDYISDMKTENGAVSKTDIEHLNILIDNLIPQELADDIKDYVDNYTKQLYSQEYKNVSLDISYNLSSPDTRMIGLISKANIAWIKNNESNKELSRSVTDEFAKLKTLGMTRKQAALMLEKKFGPFVPDVIGRRYGNEKYWDGFVRQHATRCRSFADIDAYSDAGIQSYQIYARLSERTCEICAGLHGMVFSVKDALTSKSRYIEAAMADDVEGMKKATPWVYEPVLNAKKESKRGLMPPFHFRCECRTHSFVQKTGRSEYSNIEVNLSETGDKVKWMNYKGEVKNAEILYSVLSLNRNILVTDKSIEHIRNKNKETARHRKYGKIDSENYKNIAETLGNLESVYLNGSDLFYIGKNGYIVVCKDNIVLTSYFADYGGDNNKRPQNLEEAIKKANECFKKKGGEKWE